MLLLWQILKYYTLLYVLLVFYYNIHKKIQQHILQNVNINIQKIYSWVLVLNRILFMWNWKLEHEFTLDQKYSSAFRLCWLVWVCQTLYSLICQAAVFFFLSFQEPFWTKFYFLLSCTGRGKRSENSLTPKKFANLTVLSFSISTAKWVKQDSVQLLDFVFQRT